MRSAGPVIVGPRVLCGDTGDPGMQVAFQALGAIEMGQPVSEPEQEATKKRHNGERLLFDELSVGWRPRRLHLFHGRFADRDKIDP
jgi:hypothetical protein